MFEFIKDLFKGSKVKVYSVGPNNFAELLKQFDQPPKQKTPEDIVRDYTVKETMAALELSYLREDPATFYRGSQTYYNEGVKYYDWVPCALRPEVVYCCYGKN
jgi:hypothetical protein